jgi:hypothetical protein
MDWMDTPLGAFGLQHEMGADGRTTGRMFYPHGEGLAQLIMADLLERVMDSYFGLLDAEEGEILERTGEVPLVVDGRTVETDYRNLTLRDLPAVLDALAELEDENVTKAQEEKERLDAERKRRRNARERERRRRKKLGEW